MVCANLIFTRIRESFEAIGDLWDLGWIKQCEGNSGHLWAGFIGVIEELDIAIQDIFTDDVFWMGIQVAHLGGYFIAYGFWPCFHVIEKTGKGDAIQFIACTAGGRAAGTSSAEDIEYRTCANASVGIGRREIP